MSDNTAGGFDLALTASGQEVSLGTMPNQSVIAYETIFPMFAFKDAITSLMNNPLPKHHTSMRMETNGQHSASRFQIKMQLVELMSK